MCSTGRARAACQRSIESGKSEPQVRKLSISAGCLFSAVLKWPKSAESPVSLTPKKIFLPLGASASACAPGAEAQHRAAATRATSATRVRVVPGIRP